MTQTLAKEWGRYKVNVNCVAFGFIKTRLTQTAPTATATIDVEGARDPGRRQPADAGRHGAMIPLGRGGTPEEAAGAVYLFCIPESNYITGQVVVCGGGLII